VSISGLSIQNGSANSGGGILNQGVLTLSNCALIGNSAGGGAGGAIFNGRPFPGFDAAGSPNAAPLTINNCTLSGNSAGIGGAIYNQLIALTLSGSTLSGNSASAGGGIYNFGTLTMSNSTLSWNSAPTGGGGIYNSGSLTISNSTLSGNSAGAGGGIESLGEPLTITNSTLSGNSATSNGGAIYGFGMTISDSTLSGNSAPIGGGINGGATLKNTILANSTSGGNCSVASGTLTSLGYNLSDDPSCASYFNQPGDMNSTGAGLDPRGLNSNGGPTQTIALLPASPAVDAIPVSACTDVTGNPVTTDERGVARPQGRGCDIGAFELVPQGMPIPLARLQ
jgi:predicted outer membrane repeat protein